MKDSASLIIKQILVSSMCIGAAPKRQKNKNKQNSQDSYTLSIILWYPPCNPVLLDDLRKKHLHIAVMLCLTAHVGFQGSPNIAPVLGRRKRSSAALVHMGKSVRAEQNTSQWAEPGVKTCSSWWPLSRSYGKQIPACHTATGLSHGP